MYNISDLEGMKFKELKRLAREKNISRRWTCKVIGGRSIFLGHLSLIQNL